MVKCNCLNCGKEFVVADSQLRFRTPKYCSNDCYNQSRVKKAIPLVTRICKQCGKEFEDRPIRAKFGRGNYCSIECRDKSKERRSITFCDQCGKQIEVINSQYTTGKKKYCSKECHNKSMFKQKLIKCDCCGKEFYRIPCQCNETRNYCSNECRAQDWIGENNPSYVNGASYGDYCKKFNNPLKERVRAFFGYKCLGCGLPQEDNTTKSGKVIKLDVHHISYDKWACCDDKKPLFAPLCMHCHAKTQGKQERRYEWQEYYENIINTKYNGKCYYTKEEYKSLTAPPSVQTLTPPQSQRQQSIQHPHKVQDQTPG